MLLGACSSVSPLPCGVVQKATTSLCCVVSFWLQLSSMGDIAVYIDLAACHGLFAVAAWSLFQCVTFTLWGCAKDCSEFMMCSAFWSQLSSVGDVAVQIDLAACHRLFATAAWSLF
ncbi:hypothetical protein ACFX2I_035811 [Malus domestica]